MGHRELVLMLGLAVLGMHWGFATIQLLHLTSTTVAILQIKQSYNFDLNTLPVSATVPLSEIVKKLEGTRI